MYLIFTNKIFNFYYNYFCLHHCFRDCVNGIMRRFWSLNFALLSLSLSLTLLSFKTSLPSLSLSHRVSKSLYKWSHTPKPTFSPKPHLSSPSLPPLLLLLLLLLHSLSTQTSPTFASHKHSLFLALAHRLQCPSTPSSPMESIPFN